MSSTRLFPNKDLSRLERTDEKIEYNRKIFIAFEGQDTEPTYFKNITHILMNESKSIVDIIPLDRDELDGKSHPKHVRDGMIEYYTKNKKMIDDRDSLWIVIDIDKHFGNKLKDKKINYLDFLESLKTSIKKEIFAAVSMPCFELWLILHHESPSNLDLEKIKKNLKISKHKRYLKDLVSNLEKTNGKEVYLNFNKAISNAKDNLLEQDTYNLYKNVGTSIYKLIEDILK